VIVVVPEAKVEWKIAVAKLVPPAIVTEEGTFPT
jgi:hypothetical protein